MSDLQPGDEVWVRAFVTTDTARFDNGVVVVLTDTKASHMTIEMHRVEDVIGPKELLPCPETSHPREIANLRQLLAEHTYPTGVYGNRDCVECRSSITAGHTEDCRIAAALSEPEVR